MINYSEYGEASYSNIFSRFLPWTSKKQVKNIFYTTGELTYSNEWVSSGFSGDSGKGGPI